MRKLSFEGFLAQYVNKLSCASSSSMRSLAKEALNVNPRLREPLMVYAVISRKTSALLSAVEGTAFGATCSRFFSAYDAETLPMALNAQTQDLPREVQKVWLSYQAVLQRPERDVRVKALYCERVMQLQNQTGVSTYQLCKTLGLNNSNTCTWLRTKEGRYMTLENARKILTYLQAQAPSSQ